MVLEEYTYVFAIGTFFALLEAYNNGASTSKPFWDRISWDPRSLSWAGTDADNVFVYRRCCQRLGDQRFVALRYLSTSHVSLPDI